MKIGYLTFGRDDFGYGLALCLDRLKGHEIYRVTPKTAKLVDVLLFSCFWWEHVFLLADFLRKANIKKADSDRPKIIVGGFNTFNPVPFMAYTDFVVCGDGEEILPRVVAGEISEEITSWQNVNPLKAFCHSTNGISRIEIARGCKFRCRFCAVSHLKPYREVPVEEISTILRSVKDKRVSLFAPETTLHSGDNELAHECMLLGKTRLDSDVRLDQLDKKNMDSGVPRIGLEGLSERLRKSILKPYPNETVVGCVEKAILDGLKGLMVYLILDLPGEEAEDFEEFKMLLRKIGEIPGASSFMLKPSPNLFMPNPHTPMEYDGIHWERPYRQAWEDLFGRGNQRDWQVIMAERTRVFSPLSRILTMLSIRGGEEFAGIEEELSRAKIIQVSGGRIHCKSERGLLNILKKYGGPEKYCSPRSPEDDNPWKRLII